MDLYVYLIICTETKRIYVGRSERCNRMRAHLQALRHNRHNIKLMQSDFNDYGEESFSFTIIQNAVLEVKANFEWEHKDEILHCGAPKRSGRDIRHTEKEWMIRLKTYDPNYGYNYLDPCFINGVKNNKNKKKIVAEMYNFPESLL